VPWPPSAARLLDVGAARQQEMGRGKGGARDAYRAAFRAAALRWHPDKFEARFGQRLAPGEPGEEVRARVQAVAQAVTDAWARVAS
jgi:broad specificity phosphatase PhoE